MICNSGLLLTRKLKELVAGGSVDGQPVKKPPLLSRGEPRKPQAPLISSQSVSIIEPVTTPTETDHLCTANIDSNAKNCCAFGVNERISSDRNDDASFSEFCADDRVAEFVKVESRGVDIDKREMLVRSKTSSNFNLLTGRLALCKENTNVHFSDTENTPKLGNLEYCNKIVTYEFPSSKLPNIEPNVQTQHFSKYNNAASRDATVDCRSHLPLETEVSVQSGGAVSTRISCRSPSFAASKRLVLYASEGSSDNSKANTRFVNTDKKTTLATTNVRSFLSEKKCLSTPELLHDLSRKKKKPRGPIIHLTVNHNSIDENHYATLINRENIRLKHENDECNDYDGQKIEGTSASKFFSFDRRWKSHHNPSGKLTELDGKVSALANKVVGSPQSTQDGNCKTSDSVTSHNHEDGLIYENLNPYLGEDRNIPNIGTYPMVKPKFAGRLGSLNKATISTKEFIGKSFSPRLSRKFTNTAGNTSHDNKHKQCNYLNSSVLMDKPPHGHIFNNPMQRRERFYKPFSRNSKLALETGPLDLPTEAPKKSLFTTECNQTESKIRLLTTECNQTESKNRLLKTECNQTESKNSLLTTECNQTESNLQIERTASSRCQWPRSPSASPNVQPRRSVLKKKQELMLRQTRSAEESKYIIYT